MSFFRIENDNLIIEREGMRISFPDVREVSAKTDDAGGLSLPYTDITAVGERTRHYHVWDGLPLVYMPDYSEKSLYKLTGEHWLIRAVRLHAFSDDNDTLAEENEYHLFAGKIFLPMTGEMFFLEDPESGDALVIISEDPYYARATLKIQNKEIFIENNGNPVALGFCKSGECEALAREYYRYARKPQRLVTMSNTWGDRNGISRVCRDFVLREVDTAKELGVDIVQIDDGWQVGRTGDPAIYDEHGLRHFDGDFWEINAERFPNGIREVTDYAEKDGVKVGLWFAPDSNLCFKLLERDKAVLRRAYEEWGARFFKLDMYWVLNGEYRDKFLELLREIYTFGEDVAVQLDVTRDNRVNYLCGRQYGTVFVENRYHASANSFPHRVLRNLWTLGRYLPTQKFQFELINPDLFRENYREGDPFVPSLYDMDYLFAAVMLSNPLFWMEMQFLKDERREPLKRIMDIWKEHRDALSSADIQPIGDKPTGRSNTGFVASTSGEAKYLLLFREVNDSGDAVFTAPVKAGEIKILASNTDAQIELSDGVIRMKTAKPRSYVFAEII
ncbi:MAG: alpha-galactosidase [Clostridia bacterium]|nr:alpha-galactosidase [Clostridia bacterium]